ncbi:MAG: YkgJ family cysteine cluster protein [Candidatus Omnitrophota bacterium]
MRQLLPKEACLKCQGCCRFAEAATIWAPALLDKEIKTLLKKNAAAFISPGKKLKPVASKDKNIFLCPFLNCSDNQCKIYSLRPLECRLYPFLINRSSGKIYLAVDRNCPFVSEKMESKPFKDYAAYLARLLNGRAFRKLLKDNPQIIQAYPQVTNIARIKV